MTLKMLPNPRNNEESIIVATKHDLAPVQILFTKTKLPTPADKLGTKKIINKITRDTKKLAPLSKVILIWHHYNVIVNNRSDEMNVH